MTRETIEQLRQSMRDYELAKKHATTEKNYSMNAQKLFELVRDWAEEKGITGEHGRGTVIGQLGKVNEEIAELNNAIRDVDDDEIIDAIGDSIVTLIILGDLLGFRAEDCLQSAYEVISKRTGKMVNGTFVKDA